MEEFDFVKAMEIIRSNSDKVYLLEGDRKPILIVSCKDESDHIELLSAQIEKLCKDRLDFILIEGVDDIKIGEKSTSLERVPESSLSRISSLDI